MCISVFSFLDLYICTSCTVYFVDKACHNHEGVLLLDCLLECPQCHNRCKNAGGLYIYKTHMSTHKKTETKSEPLLKWVIKHVKSEIMPSENPATETPKTTRP